MLWCKGCDNVNSNWSQNAWWRLSFFFDNNLLQWPPDTPQDTNDLNTGHACMTTCWNMITDLSKQILLPAIFHMHAASTGQFVDLPIAALKMTLGIFNWKACDKDHLWQTLGCAPQTMLRNSKRKLHVVWIKSRWKCTWNVRSRQRRGKQCKRCVA